MSKPATSEGSQIREGLNDAYEMRVTKEPISDEGLTAILLEVGLKSVEGEDGQTLVVIGNGPGIKVTTSDTHEVAAVPHHEDCEVCGGGSAYATADLASITFLSLFDRDSRGNPLVEAEFIRDDNGDWMFVPGQVAPLATDLGRVAGRLAS